MCIKVDICDLVCWPSQEKSSIDWHKYKQEEGLEEELAQNSKDG